MRTARTITDTTLLYNAKRMSTVDRIAWASLLESIGIQEMITAYTTQSDFEALQRGLQSATHSLYIIMNTAQLSKALLAGAQSIHLEIPASYPMIYTQYHKNKDWVRKELLDCKELLYKRPTRITIVLADASRAEPCFLESLVQLLAGLPIEILIAKDIMGIQPMSACSNLIGTMLEFGYCIGYEGSDQYGLSVANTIQALRTGATIAHTCLGGYGGGCDLRRLLQTTNRIFDYSIDRKGAEQLDRTFKQHYRSLRLQGQKNQRHTNRRICR